MVLLIIDIFKRNHVTHDRECQARFNDMFSINTAVNENLGVCICTNHLEQMVYSAYASNDIEILS